MSQVAEGAAVGDALGVVQQLAQRLGLLMELPLVKAVCSVAACEISKLWVSMGLRA